MRKRERPRLSGGAAKCHGVIDQVRGAGGAGGGPRRLAGKSGFRGLSQSPGRGRQGRLWQLPRAATMAPLSPPPLTWALYPT